MPLLLDTTPAAAAAVELRCSNCIEIGLVNNMPDAALEATERQFVDLIRAATTDVVVRLRLYALPDVPRGERGRQETASRYRDVSELWDSHLDGLVVTGTEPRAADLRNEPYWPTLAKLVDWARDNTASGIEGAWHRPAVRIYENWLHDLKTRIAGRRQISPAAQRSRQGGWPTAGMRPAADRSSVR